MKRYRLTEWIKTKQDTSIYCLKGTHFRPKDKYRLKSEDWKWRDGKIFHANGNRRKKSQGSNTSDKINFKTKAITRVKIILFFFRVKIIK